MMHDKSREILAVFFGDAHYLAWEEHFSLYSHHYTARLHLCNMTTTLTMTLWVSPKKTQNVYFTTFSQTVSFPRELHMMAGSEWQRSTRVWRKKCHSKLDLIAFFFLHRCPYQPALIVSLFIIKFSFIIITLSLVAVEAGEHQKIDFFIIT